MKKLLTTLCLLGLSAHLSMALPKSLTEEFYVIGFEDALSGKHSPVFPENDMIRMVADHTGMPLLSGGMVRSFRQAYDAGFERAKDYKITVWYVESTP